ncbi:hypothetical protein ACFY04_12255 [Streptomyces sp. NPDC001549]|uniref:hypothetical protein n=1 Tax=Streptomyces sp. NPDC001549 TaxID=3364586 RepID=UPI00367723BD
MFEYLRERPPASRSPHEPPVGDGREGRLRHRSVSAPGSKTFYDRKRAEGKSHKQAILALARRRMMPVEPVKVG